MPASCICKRISVNEAMSERERLLDELQNIRRLMKYAKVDIDETMNLSILVQRECELLNRINELQIILRGVA